MHDADKKQWNLGCENQPRIKTLCIAQKHCVEQILKRCWNYSLVQEKGQVLEGVVSLQGVFVDLGGVDGLPPLQTFMVTYQPSNE
jgi:hypothetical protein